MWKDCWRKPLSEDKTLILFWLSTLIVWLKSLLQQSRSGGLYHLALLIALQLVTQDTMHAQQETSTRILSYVYWTVHHCDN